MISHNLKKHQIKQKLSNDCEHCEFKANNKAELEYHFHTSHSKFQCEQCQYSTYRKALLDQHLHRKHADRDVEDKIEFKITANGEETFFCKQCTYQNKVHLNIKRHVQCEHLGKKHPCNECGHEFTNISNLHQHIKRKHTKNFEWQCDQCEKQFQYESNLKSHVRIIHLGIKHKCSKCKSEFPEKNNLRRHFIKYHS